MKTISNKEKFLKQYKKCEDINNRLDIALQKLGSITSNIYGETLVADICVGGEIEFRSLDDAFSCLTIEDIIEKLDQDETEG